MTFLEALLFANESGWVIYSLNQACCDSDPPWRCCLREAEGGHRRQISRGTGDTPEDAIVDALSKAPELEAEANVVISDNIAIARGDGIPDLLALLVGPKPQSTRTR